MSARGTRRNFLGRINLALAGLAFTRTPFQKDVAAHELVSEPVDYYNKLGITKRINAAGTYTYLTGALMPPSVQAAVARLPSIRYSSKICRRLLANTLRKNCGARAQWSQRARLPQ